MRTGRISDDQTRVSLLNGASSGSLPRGHFPHRHVKGRHAKVASFPRDFTPTACRPRFASGAGSIAETGEIRGMRARAKKPETQNRRLHLPCSQQLPDIDRIKTAAVDQSGAALCVPQRAPRESILPARSN